MNSNNNSTQFIEHSFRRLSLLIHQQDLSNNIPTTISMNKTNEQLTSSINNINNDELVSFSSKNQYYQQLPNENSIESKEKIVPISKVHRTYMRPPKNRTTISYRCSSSQFSDRSDTSIMNQSLNSPCSPSIIQSKINELPLHMPYERTPYDVKFERDRQNDIREKYNIPPPFQRKWLRQPRYVPQERPNFGQIQQSQNQ